MIYWSSRATQKTGKCTLCVQEVSKFIIMTGQGQVFPILVHGRVLPILVGQERVFPILMGQRRVQGRNLPGTVGQRRVFPILLGQGRVFANIGRTGKGTPKMGGTAGVFGLFVYSIYQFNRWPDHLCKLIAGMYVTRPSPDFPQFA